MYKSEKSHFICFMIVIHISHFSIQSVKVIRWNYSIETGERADIETPWRRVAWRLIILIVSGRSETTGSFVTWPAHREDASDMLRISDDLAVQPGRLCRSEYYAAVAVVSAARCRASVFGRDWRLSRRCRYTSRRQIYGAAAQEAN